MLSRTFYSFRQLLGATTLTLLLSACASAPPEPLSIETTQELAATVDAINLGTRMVSLRDSKGQTLTVQVAPVARNLDQVKVGDRVVVRYQQGLAAELRQRGDGSGQAEAPVMQTGAIRTPAGSKPGGLIAAQSRQTVRILEVDTKNNVVGFYGSDGLARSLPVRSPEGQEFISKLNKGDEVELTYTESVALSVEPAK